NRGDHREGVSRSGVVENSRDAFQRGQQSLHPYLAQPWPSPSRQRSDLAWLQVRPVPDWRKSDKLKDEVAEPQHRESDPNPLVATESAKTVNERSPHGRKKHYQRITTAKPQPAVNAGHCLRHASKDW